MKRVVQWVENYFTHHFVMAGTSPAMTGLKFWIQSNDNKPQNVAIWSRRARWNAGRASQRA